MWAKIIARTGAALLFSITAAHALQPVLQRGYEAGVSGANLSEVALNTSNVAPSTFGLVFKLPVDDNVYAQPLYVPSVAIPGQGTHNVVYVATMSDSLYAFDADTGAPLWSVNFASRVGATPVPIAQFTFSGNRNIVGNLGILSTPVIDPLTHVMYLVACTLENSTMAYRLHAVDITTGAEPQGPGVLISGSYGGSTFDARYQTQRVSLALSGNQVVFGFAAVELEYSGGYVGWVMAYNKLTLQQSGVFATVTTGNRGGGVWQSGRPPVIDSAGYTYVYVGNAYGGGYDGVHDFSESVLKLDPANGLQLVDWFTPSNWSAMDSGDLDLTSSGPMLIPGTGLIAGGGKTGVLYVLNTANLGKESPTDSGAVQKQAISVSEIHGGPVYWQRSAANGGPLLYDWGASDWVKAYPFNGTTIATAPSSQGSGSQIWPGGILALSANNDTPGSGVLWATVATSGNASDNPPVPGALYAFDAGNVSKMLWNSTMNASRDGFGNFAKFVPPLVANGRVYAATQSNQVAVYGLLTATPTFSPAPGSYTTAQSVTLSDTTPGAVIYYTTNGATPTTNSAKYSAPIAVGTTETIKALAVASGYANSAVASGGYVLTSGGGGGTSINLSAVDNVHGIASNGTAPINGGWDNEGYAYSAALLGASITYGGSTYTFGAAGAADAVSNTTIPLPAGNYTTLSLLGSAANGNQTNQSFVVTYADGTTTKITQSLSNWWGPPQNYAGESQVLNMTYLVKPTGATLSRAVYVYGYSFAINSAKTVKSLTLPANRNVIILALDVTNAGAPAAATPTFSPAPGSYTTAQSVTLSDTTPGAVIYYTTNGATPTTNSAKYSAPIAVGTTETIKALAVASGYANSAVASGGYVLTSGGGGGTSINLSAVDNVHGIASNGTAPINGGWDNEGYAYSAALLGASITYGGSTYTFGAAGAADAVSNTTIPLPAGNYTTLSLLGSAANGNQTNQSFVVTYADGTTTKITQSLSNWWGPPQNYAGESQVLNMTYLVKPTGATLSRAVYVYGYSFAINSAKTVKSLTLPANRNVIILALDMVP